MSVIDVVVLAVCPSVPTALERASVAALGGPTVKIDGLVIDVLLRVVV